MQELKSEKKKTKIKNPFSNGGGGQGEERGGGRETENCQNRLKSNEKSTEIKKKKKLTPLIR